MTSGAISVRGVSKRFGDLAVLDDIAFEVADGETVALLGTSGCGKSTLLNIVAGLIDPDAGELWLGDARATRPEDRRALAYMFQEDRLLPWRSVRANAEFGLEAARPALSAKNGGRARLPHWRSWGWAGSRKAIRTSCPAACAAASRWRAAWWASRASC